jgi:hypothetical protein
MGTTENARLSLLVAFFGSQPGNLLKASAARKMPVSAVVGSCSGWSASMEYDRDNEMVLALLWLTAFDEDQFRARAWKSHDRGALDRLHEKGYISDPKSKAKSVVLSVVAAVAGPVRTPFMATISA